MTILEWAIAFWVSAGLLAFSAFAIRIWTLSERPAFRRTPTSWVVWSVGAGLVWLAALLLAGAVFGLAAKATWRLLA